MQCDLTEDDLSVFDVISNAVAEDRLKNTLMNRQRFLWTSSEVAKRRREEVKKVKEAEMKEKEFKMKERKEKAVEKKSQKEEQAKRKEMKKKAKDDAVAKERMRAEAVARVRLVKGEVCDECEICHVNWDAWSKEEILSSDLWLICEYCEVYSVCFDCAKEMKKHEKNCQKKATSTGATKRRKIKA